MSRALRRRQQLLAKVHHRRIVCEAWGWKYWVEGGWRGTISHRWRPLGDQLMTESGHKHWRKTQMTAPERAQEHQQLRLVERGIDADLFRWPDHKKPFIYYW